MENSFYYFFSATPQVLSGVLALFGFYVLFKLQQLTKGLLLRAKEFQHLAQYTFDKEESAEKKKLRIKVETAFDRSIISENLSDFKENLDISQKNNLYVGDKISIRMDRFYNLYNAYKSLKDGTIRLSCFTAVIIVLCLSLIPFGNSFFCHIYLLYLVYIIVITSLIIIFYKLYQVLSKSLN
jgi:hypothetical protein